MSFAKPLFEVKHDEKNYPVSSIGNSIDGMRPHDNSANIAPSSGVHEFNGSTIRIDPSSSGRILQQASSGPEGGDVQANSGGSNSAELSADSTSNSQSSLPRISQRNGNIIGGAVRSEQRIYGTSKRAIADFRRKVMTINWQELTSLAELGGNVALTALGASGVLPANSAVIASGVEAAVNPLILAIQGKSPIATDIQAGYGALIGGLMILKNQTSIDPALLTKINEYLSAAQAGLSAYMTEESAFTASLFTVNDPLTPAA